MGKQRQQQHWQQQQHATSNVWYEPVATSRLAGVYRLSSLMMRSAGRDLLGKDSGCFLLQACPNRRVLPWLCAARLMGYFWFFVRLLGNPDMGNSHGGCKGKGHSVLPLLSGAILWKKGTF
jgi:hypothetical protein